MTTLEIPGQHQSPSSQSGELLKIAVIVGESRQMNTSGEKCEIHRNLLVVV